MSTPENTARDEYLEADYFDDKFTDDEYLDLECPSCRKIMPDDDTFLNHICKEKEYVY